MTNKIIKFFILVLIIVLVVELATLINSVDRKVSKVKQTTPLVKVKEETPVFDVRLISEFKEMKIGKTYKVKLEMKAHENKTIDVIDNYIKYNSSNFKISNLVFDKKLPKPESNTVVINKEKGLVLGTILIDKKPGLKISKDETIPILSFNVTPLKAGIFKLEIGKDKLETMIVESGTSELLPFSVKDIEVSVNTK